MAAVPPAARDAFGADLMLVSQTCRSATGTQRANSQDNTWEVWLAFCTEVGVDPLLERVEDAIPYLQVFAQRYRDGRLAKDGKPVRSRTVEDALRAIGQTMASMGSVDKRLVGPRRMEYRLQQLLAGWDRVDPAPKRVRPVPISLVQYLVDTAITPAAKAIADMSTVGFFYLCRPGEHVECQSRDSLSDPFRLSDVEFGVQTQRIRAHHASMETLGAAGSATLVFSHQKNGVRGEGILHGRSRHSTVCPVLALLRRVEHLKQNHATPDTPIYTYYTNGLPNTITSSDITWALRRAAAACFPITGIDPSTISARSLRPGGATALLCAQVDTNVTRLIGRWRSDEMLRYLHLQAAPLMQHYAAAMFQHGSFTFIPNNNTEHVPVEAQILLQQHT